MAGKKKDELKPTVPVNPISPRAVEGSAGYTKPVKVKKEKSQRWRDFQYINSLDKFKASYSGDFFTSVSTANPFYESLGVDDPITAQKKKLQKRFQPSQWAIQKAEEWANLSREQKRQIKWEDPESGAISDFINFNESWATAAPSIKRKALIEAAQITSVGEPFGKDDIFFSRALSKNPELAFAVAKGINNKSLSKRQLVTINKATQLLETAAVFVNANSDLTRLAIVGGLKPKQIEALDNLLQAIFKEYEQRSEEAAKEEQNPIIGFLGSTVGAVLDGLMWINDNAQHLYRSAAFTATRGEVPVIQNIIKNWDDVELGAVESEQLNRIKTEYGEKNVQIVREVFALANKEDGFSELLSKYGDDQEALNIIDQIMFEDIRSDEISKLIKDYTTISVDDLGNIVANALLPDDWRMEDGVSLKKATFDLVDTTVNFSAVWFGDPTLIGAKVAKGYKILKYGLVKDSGLSNLERILETPKVRRFVDNVAPRIDELNKEVDVQKAMDIRLGIKRDFGKYLNDDAINSLSAFFKETERTFDTASDAFAAWMRESDGFARLLMGRPVRAEQFLMPRMTRGRQRIIQRKLRKNNVIKFDGSERAFLNVLNANVFSDDFMKAQFGLSKTDDISKLADSPEFQAIMQEAQAKNLIEAFTNPESRRLISERYGVNIDSLRFGFGDTAQEGMYEYGKRKYRAWSVSREAWAKRTDDFLRNFENAPLQKYIIIDDARDADLIYSWARTTFSRTLSNYVREMWTVMTPGQRRLFLNGMFETIADAKGIIGVNDTQRAVRNRLVTSGTKQGEQYGVKISEIKNVDGNDVVVPYNPAEINGTSDALHIADTKNAIALPNFALLQQASVKIGVLEKIIGWTFGDRVTSITSSWSNWNLLGPRYQQRAQIEDIGGFYLTGGTYGELVWGKIAAQARREALGRTTGVVGETARTFGDVTTRLANSIRRLGKDVPAGTLPGGKVTVKEGEDLASTLDETVALPDGGGFQKAMGMLIRKHLNREDILDAQKALQSNNPEKFQRLMYLALSRMTISPIMGSILTRGKIKKEVADRALRNYAMLGEDAISRLDDRAEIGRDLNGFVAIDSRLSSTGARLRKDLRGKKNQPARSYVASDAYKSDLTFEEDPLAFYSHWYKQLEKTLHGDGDVGQHVFRALADSKNLADAQSKAVPLIVDEINSGAFPIWRFSLASKVESMEEFAVRYFQNAAHYFVTREGKINKQLIDGIRRQKEDGVVLGKLYLASPDGATKSHIGIDFLETLGDARPDHVLGRLNKYTLQKETGQTVAEKAMNISTDALARTSREKIFFARFIPEYATLEKSLLPVYVNQGMKPEVAQKLITRLAEDRADYLTLSYVDNPNIRSIGAYSARNIGRYYRATEDFARRVLRVNKYNPEAIQKVNVLYGSLSDTGFTWEDENGEQYFIYPGTGALHKAVATVLNFLPFPFDMYTTSPYAFAGRTSMLTPSADPDAWLPTFSSPIAGFLIKGFTSLGPFEELEGWLLGPKSVQKPGDPAEWTLELFNSILPSHFRRALNTLPIGERQSQYAMATKGAIQILAYNGELDSANIKTKADEDAILNKMYMTAFGVLATKFILGFLVPASPQLVQNDRISNELRALGVKSLRKGFLDLVNKYDADIDKALATWYKLNPKLMPFTVSGSETSVTGTPPFTNKSLKWFEENKDFAKKYVQSSAFLSPAGGDFSIKAYSMISSLSYSMPAEVRDYFVKSITSQDYFVYKATQEDYEAARADATTSSERARADQIWTNLKAEMFASNPYLEERIMPDDMGKIKRERKLALQEMRDALTDIYTNKVAPVNKQVEKIYTMIRTYDDAMIEYAKYKGSNSYVYVNERKRIRETLMQILEEYSADNIGATNFYNRILKPLIEG